MADVVTSTIATNPRNSLAWKQLDFGQIEHRGSRRRGQTQPRERSHLPEVISGRPDAIESNGPIMRVTWELQPRLENPAHQHLIAQESPDGARSKMYLMNHIAQAFGARDYEYLYWADLSAPIINTIMAELRDLGYKETTRNAYLTVMKMTSREAWIAGQMELETYEKIRAISRVKSKRIKAGKSQSLDMLMGLVDAVRADKNPHSRRNALLLEIMIFTGMRRREVRGIQIPDHIFIEKQDILIQGKGGTDRWAKLPDDVWDNLMDYLSEERGWDAGALFCAYWNKRSTPKISDVGLNVSNINRILAKSLKLYVSQRDEAYGDGKDADMAPHDIRRSFATAMHELGHTPREIQIFLGHSSISTTEGYLHDDKDGYRDDAQKTLNAVLAKRKGGDAD